MRIYKKNTYYFYNNTTLHIQFSYYDSIIVTSHLYSFIMKCAPGNCNNYSSLTYLNTKIYFFFLININFKPEKQ